MGDNSFNKVLKDILEPAGITVGGYPEELFVNISDEEIGLWTCNICYLIARDAKECVNKHLFCGACIFAWSMTGSDRSQKCPVCLADGNSYKDNVEIDKLLGEKRVMCTEKETEHKCMYTGQLKYFIQYHLHGKQYNNQNAQWDVARDRQQERLRRERLQNTGGFPFFDPNQLILGRIMLQHMMAEFQMELERRRQNIRDAERRGDLSISDREREVRNLSFQLEEIETMLTLLTVNMIPIAPFPIEVALQTGPSMRYTRRDREPPRQVVEIPPSVSSSSDESSDESSTEPIQTNNNGRSRLLRQRESEPSSIILTNNLRSTSTVESSTTDNRLPLISVPRDTHADFRRAPVDSIISPRSETQTGILPNVRSPSAEDGAEESPGIETSDTAANAEAETSDRSLAARASREFIQARNSSQVDGSGAAQPNSVVRQRSAHHPATTSRSTAASLTREPLARRNRTSSQASSPLSRGRLLSRRRSQPTTNVIGTPNVPSGIINSATSRSLIPPRRPAGASGTHPATTRNEAGNTQATQRQRLPTTPGALLRARRRRSSNNDE